MSSTSLKICPNLSLEEHTELNYAFSALYVQICTTEISSKNPKL